MGQVCTPCLSVSIGIYASIVLFIVLFHGGTLISPVNDRGYIRLMERERRRVREITIFVNCRPDFSAEKNFQVIEHSRLSFIPKHQFNKTWS